MPFTGTQIDAVAFPGDPTTGNQAERPCIDDFTGTLYGRIVIRAAATRSQPTAMHPV